MTTVYQDTEFAKEVLDPDTLLEKAIKWIKDNMEPNEVYDGGYLAEWVMENRAGDLEKWAEDQGYVEG